MKRIKGVTTDCGMNERHDISSSGKHFSIHWKTAGRVKPTVFYCIIHQQVFCGIIKIVLEVKNVTVKKVYFIGQVWSNTANSKMFWLKWTKVHTQLLPTITRFAAWAERRFFLAEVFFNFTKCWTSLWVNGVVLHLNILTVCFCRK